MPRRESDTSDSLFMTPEAYKATEAVEFIAEHLRNEDEYIQVSESLRVIESRYFIQANPKRLSNLHYRSLWSKKLFHPFDIIIL